jgi:hypothetical protein
MKSSKLKIKIKKRLYRNIGYTLLLLFSFYICYKTYKTQQIKKREGFKEGAAKAPAESDSSAPTTSKDDLNNSIAEAIEACIATCPIDVNECPEKDDCKGLKGSDLSDCKEGNTDANTCQSNIKVCKKTCSAGDGDKKGGDKKGGF